MKFRKIGYYDYTVVLTYIGMLVACCGIFELLSGHYQEAILCLMVAGLCDTFDGTVAHTKDNRTLEEMRFGVQIDSLSDLISFGVLPALFVYVISGKKAGSGAIAAVYMLSALIRLAYFNVLEEQRQREMPEQRGVFLGVPVTTICLSLPLVFILYGHSIIRTTRVFPFILILTGVGFLTPIEIKKPSVAVRVAMVAVGAAETAALLLMMK